MKNASLTPLLKSVSRWRAGFKSFCAVFSLGVGLLLPNAARAATIVAQAAGNITVGSTWTGGVAPTAGDSNIWQSGGFTINHATAGGSFLGQTLEITTGGNFRNGQADSTTDTVRNLTLSGGIIDHPNSLAWTVNLAGNTFTLNSGTLKAGTSANVSFQNAVLAGSGTITVSSANPTTPSPSYFRFFGASTTTVGFTGTFSVSANGRLLLPAITTANASFGLTINPGGTGTACWDNTVSIAIKSLSMNGNTIAPGVYTPAGLVALNAGYAACFITPADNVNTITVMGSLTYGGNGNTGGTAPASVLYVPATGATVAGGGSLVKAGAIFGGWNTAADGSGTTYSPGDTYTDTAHTTLYAIWQNPAWANDASGLWDTAGNWVGSTIADGSDVTADFKSVNLTADRTVSLNTARTIGSLIFGDTDTGSASSWIVDNNGNSGNTLTLTGVAPTITVNALGTGKSASISAVVAGSAGLAKMGVGTLVLSGANTYTGGTTISNGMVSLSGSGTLGASTGALTLSGGTADLGGGSRTNGAVSITTAAGSGHTITNGTLTGASYAASLTSGTATVSAILAGSGGLTLNSASAGGTLVLSGANTYTGVTTVSTNGTLTILGNQPAANGGFSVGDNDGGNTPPVLNINSGATVAVGSDKTFKIGRTTSATGQNAIANIVGTVINSGTLIVGRPGTLNLNSGGVWSQSGATLIQGQGNAQVASVAVIANINAGSTFSNLYSGSPVRIETATGGAWLGVVQLNISGQFITGAGFDATQGSSGAGYPQVTITNGTLTLTTDLPNLFAATAQQVRCGISGTATIDTGSHSVTIQNAVLDGVVSINGTVSGTGGALTKIGSGTLTLNNVNTYTGATTINNGKLVGVVGGSSTGSAVTVAATSGNTAVLGVSIPNTNNQWTCASVTVNNGGASSGLDFNFGALTPSTTVSPMNLIGPVTFTTAPAVSVESGSMAITAGNGYPLLTWGSGSAPSLTGTTLALPSGYTGNLFINGSTLYLQITAVPFIKTQPLTWQPGTGTWDETASANWKDAAGVNLAYTDLADSVVFDNIAGGGTVTLNNNYQPASMLVSNASYTISGSGGIVGATALTKSGTGTLTLTTVNTYTGPTTISGGTLQLGDGTTGHDGTITSSMSVVNNGTLVYNRFGSSTYGGGISGDGSVIKSGGGTQTLTGTNTFGGGLQIQGGRVVVSGTYNTFSGGIAIDSGAALEVGGTNGAVGGNVITNNGAVVISRTGASTFGNAITGSGSVTNQNAGTVTLTNIHTFTGGLTMDGSLLLNSPGVCLPGPIYVKSGLIKLGASEQIADTAVITYAADTISRIQLFGFNETLGGLQSPTGDTNASRIVETSQLIDNLSSSLTLNVSGAEAYNFDGFLRNGFGLTNCVLSITKNGTGSQTFNAVASRVSYSGATVINDGVLEYAGTSSVANNSAITINGGVVKFSGGGTRSNTIAGVGGLIKAGTNTLNLTGANLYTGSTVVSNGTLLVCGSIASSSTAVRAGAILGGSGVINGSVSVEAGGILAPGNNSVGRLTVTNSLTLAATTTNVFEIDVAGSTNDTVTVGGDLTAGDSVVVVSIANGNLGNGSKCLFNYTGSKVGSFNPTVVLASGSYLGHGLMIDENVAGQVNLVVTNSAPVANADSLSWGKGTSNKSILFVSLTANDTDADGDGKTVIAVEATSSNGVSLITNIRDIQYTGPLTGNDSFHYTISDGFGATATGLVSITATNSFAQSGEISATSSNATATFFGIPGTNYYVMRATNVTFDAGISNFPYAPAAANGIIQVVDDFADIAPPIPTSAFYRLFVY